MPTATELSAVVAEHIAAINAHDLDRIVGTFAPDAYVNDNRREIWGSEAIRAFMAKEFVGDHVTMEVARGPRSLRRHDRPCPLRGHLRQIQPPRRTHSDQLLRSV